MATRVITAVDRAAEDYWEKYFGAYGKAWVRKIPRRIASALIPRTATRGVDPAALFPHARVTPLGHTATRDGLLLEGTFHLEGHANTGRVFCARFDDRGRLQDIETIHAPGIGA